MDKYALGVTPSGCACVCLYVRACMRACVCVRVYVYVCVDGVHVIGPGVSGQAQAEAQPAVCSQ